ncbi:MAG: HAMP domain-containing protein [Firmicutes bacterium]|nr:HAMP domain-containing protein [Bacillota bacterium]
MIILFLGVVVMRAETYAVEMVQTAGIEENSSEEVPQGIGLPKVLQYFYPEKLRTSLRQVVWDGFIPGRKLTHWEQLASIKYRVWVELGENNAYAYIDYPLGELLLFLFPLMAVLLAFEFLFLLDSIGKGARAIRRALQPIAELTQTARKINTRKNILSDPGLRALTGTIDNIDAAELDKRISVSSTQKELKELAAAINGLLERVHNAYRSQIRFVSDASHELRTPIAVIQGYANLLDRWGKHDPEALQESIDAIKSEAEYMKSLVEQLLFLARGDNDSLQLSLERVNLSELAAEVVREAAMIDPQHEFQTYTDHDIYTVGDVQLIKQAVRILVDNSIKYTPPGGTITVKTGSDKGYAQVVVQDTGIGIGPEDVPLVFERFYRSDDSRARKTGGAGLGLSIAKWIIDRHKGYVEILSRKDIGTRITVSFPQYEIEQSVTPDLKEEENED